MIKDFFPFVSLFRVQMADFDLSDVLLRQHSCISPKKLRQSLFDMLFLLFSKESNYIVKS